MKIRAEWVVAFAFFQAIAFAHTGSQEDWIGKLREKSLEMMLLNINPSGTLSGVVVASPSKANPDYWYHWVRDGALVMDVVVSQYAQVDRRQQNASYLTLITNYIDFSRKNQLAPTPSGTFGEPKFNVDGTAFEGPWGRPQNDGPALRAVTLIHFANKLLADGKETFVRNRLYNSGLPADRIVKADLEFVSHRWKEKNFDLWEEVRGDHFYTRMVQRRALVEGSELAERLGDKGAAAWYRAQAKALEPEIDRHWDGKKGIIQVTLNRNGGVDYKHSGLDAAVILGVLHGRTAGNFYSVTDDRVLSTVRKIEIAFQQLYTINQKSIPGVAIGRYPEDRYDGVQTSAYGNAWVLTTAGFGELYHLAAARFKELGTISVTPTNKEFFDGLGVEGLSVGMKLSSGDSAFNQVMMRLKAKGDEFLERVRHHGGDGRFAEQINRWTGSMQGARDLTWSYASFITAAAAR